MSPFTPKKKVNNGVPVKPCPCGRCPACLARRASGWSFRLMQEDKRSVSSYFITLTYDTDSVPITKNGFMELSMDDVQKFYKRLRKQHASVYEHSDTDASMFRPAIKYYTVGEYGGRFKRPHYHAILFNADLELMFEKKDIMVLEYTDYDGKAHVLCKQWMRDGKPIGFVSIGKVTGASIGYTLKYMCKMRWKPMHKNDDRTREFSVMSKGLGDNYITPATIKWHSKKIDERMYLQIEQGKKIAMPRYYKQKIYTDHQKQVIQFWMEKKNRIKEKQLLQGGKIELAKDAKARVDQEYQKMYKRAENGRNKV